MSTDRHPLAHHDRPARLALRVPDAGSSGVIDVTDLRAELLVPSLAASLAASPAHPTAMPSPPARAWPMIVLRSTLALSLAFLGVAAALRLAPSMATQRASAVDGQLSVHEASTSPTAHALAPVPAAARSRATVRDRVASEPVPTTEPAKPVPAPVKPVPKLARARDRAASPSSPAAHPTVAPPAEPRAERGGSLPIECVLDPARCEDGTAPPKRPAPRDASPRPAPLPDKLSAAQLKQALAATKADARRCGPDHGADAGKTVRVLLSIEGASGSVLSATPQDEHAHDLLGRCVAGALGQTRFPRFSAKRMGTLYSVRL